MKNIDPLYDMTTYQGRFWKISFWQKENILLALLLATKSAQFVAEWRWGARNSGTISFRKSGPKFERVLECQICLRLVAPPSHWWEGQHFWPNELSSPWQYVSDCFHGHFLQESRCCCITAVLEPKFQFKCQFFKFRGSCFGPEFDTKEN